MGETVRYGCLNTVHRMPELCVVKTNHLSKTQVMSLLEKTYINCFHPLPIEIREMHICILLSFHPLFMTCLLSNFSSLLLCIYCTDSLEQCLEHSVNKSSVWNNENLTVISLYAKSNTIKIHETPADDAERNWPIPFYLSVLF